MPRSLALYIHWPFCLAKCPYCDFNSHVRDTIPQERFARALRRELAYQAERLNKEERRQLGSIFFGGGTPSLMAPETASALIDDARRHFSCVNDLEITLEANPTSVEATRFAAFRQAGINRLSLGVQSLHDDALQKLGRQHNSHQARNALELSRSLFPRLSFDLIYARPQQTLDDWRAELREALDLAADHLSLYQLTIEPGTSFEALFRRGEITLPDDELAARLYLQTAEEAARYGLERYEISNYAQRGSESRHNLTYWTYGDYLGIGPGAHSRLTFGDTLYEGRCHRAPEPWASLVEEHGHGMRSEKPLTADMRGREALLMGLRLRDGINAEHFFLRTGKTLESCLDPMILQACLEEGYLLYDRHSLRATEEGLLRLEALLARLVL
ncbi:MULTISPECIES: radical SAM family heme chaperone HemW [unclassified Saccharibacter]|uniref:radical SAM family heme chaperone HemW n=1 Tax=unclassified Saccharibacter TaxID=2648722 RepID=UPI00132C05D5|nr:coproporphyrinogen III oxidase [Saccharibacter sp. EH611]MXV58887.1 coproporphyrinogen III oxidase [Saccharibacter sp. EH70]MXV65543.1 coproporphyrinogen III oxidase [Saccharibacter sp. EH60]